MCVFSDMLDLLLPSRQADNKLGGLSSDGGSCVLVFHPPLQYRNPVRHRGGRRAGMVRSASNSLAVLGLRTPNHSL